MLQTFVEFQLHMQPLNRYDFDDIQINRFMSIYEIFDVFQDGQLARRDLTVAISRTGYYATDAQIEQLVSKLTPNDAGLYNSQQYIDVIAQLAEMNPCTEDEILRALRVYDRDKTGKIGLEEMIKVVKKIMGDAITKNEAIALISPFTQEGQVDYHTFTKAVIKLF